MSAIQNRKCVRARYIVEDTFPIPKHLDLDDKSQVQSYAVKWNTLHIELASGDMLKIEGRWNAPESFDWKRPVDFEIEDDEEAEDDDEEEETAPAEPVYKLYLSYEDADSSIEKYPDYHTALMAMKVISQTGRYDWVQICEIGTNEPVKEWVKKPKIKVEIRTWDECGRMMKKYLEDKKGDAEQRGLVFQLYTELTAQHYNEMLKICDILFSINEDYYSEDWDVFADKKKAIFDIGLKLHKQGGKYLQQLCFYLAVNFISTDKRLKSIECCWNGAGEWMF